MTDRLDDVAKGTYQRVFAQETFLIPYLSLMHEDAAQREHGLFVASPAVHAEDNPPFLLGNPSDATDKAEQAAGHSVLR